MNCVYLKRVCMYTYLYVCLPVCLSICLYVCMSVLLYVCMHLYVYYVCILCMYIYECIYAFICRSLMIYAFHLSIHYLRANEKNMYMYMLIYSVCLCASAKSPVFEMAMA